MAKKICWIHQADGARRRTPTRSPPIGPALGQRGLNIMEFCKAFNASTQNFDQGTPIPTVITAVSRTAPSRLITKTPPAAWFIQKGGQAAEGRIATPGRDTCRFDQHATRCVKSPKAKMPDLNANDIDAAIEASSPERRARWVSR